MHEGKNRIRHSLWFGRVWLGSWSTLLLMRGADYTWKNSANCPHPTLVHLPSLSISTFPAGSMQTDVQCFLTLVIFNCSKILVFHPLKNVELLKFDLLLTRVLSSWDRPSCVPHIIGQSSAFVTVVKAGPVNGGTVAKGASGGTLT